MISKKAIVRETLYREICEKRLLPGEQIPSRNQLMRRFHCSRTVVERALAELTALGMLRGHQGRGTFVSGCESETGNISRINVISPYDAVSFRSALSCILLNLNDLDIPMETIPTERAEAEMELLCTPGSLTVYINPGYELLSLMNFLRIRNVPQIIINREFDGFDRIYTDTLAGFREGIDYLQRVSNAPLSMVSRMPHISCPYLTPRLMSFYRACAERGITVKAENSFFLDDAAANNGDFSMLFKKLPAKIAVCSREFSEPVLNFALKHHLKPGKDFHFLAFEYSESLSAIPNIAIIRQKYDALYDEFLRYLPICHLPNRPEFVSVIPPEVIIS